MKSALVVVPVAAALLLGFAIGRSRAHGKDGATHQPLYYVDSMHPAYRSSKPGIAPDCGMELTPVYAEDVGTGIAAASAAQPGVLRVDAGTQQLYGIQLAKAGGVSGHETLRLFGRVAADETRVYRVDFGTDGFVKETHNDAVGERVVKDQRLASVYSPEFLSVAGGYLSANERAQGNQGGMARDNVAPTQNAASAQARADRLRILGMSEAQITELSVTRKIPEDIYVVSPANGIIVARNISRGLRFERHTDLYTIADLAHVWIMAQVSSADAAMIRPGMTAEVSVPDIHETLHARVSNVLPETDAESHTISVRLEANNPGFKLRPNMYVNVTLPVARSEGITVPADAVLDSGLRKRVFVQTSEGSFEPREVETGWRHGDQVEIVKGLESGETIAASGTFLLDSESKLQAPSLVASAGKGGARDRMTSDALAGAGRR